MELAPIAEAIEACDRREAPEHKRLSRGRWSSVADDLTNQDKVGAPGHVAIDLQGLIEATVLPVYTEFG